MAEIRETKSQLALIKLNLSLGRIAEAVGVSRPTVSGWKKGLRIPDEYKRALLEKHFGVLRREWHVPLDKGESIPENVHTEHGNNNAKKRAKHEAIGRAKDAAARRKAATDYYDDDDDDDDGLAGTDSPRGTTTNNASDPTYPTGGDEDRSTLDMVRHALACIQHDLKHRDLTASARSRTRADEMRTLTLVAKLESQRELKEDKYVREHPGWRRLRDCILLALREHPDAAESVLNAIRKEYAQ